MMIKIKLILLGIALDIAQENQWFIIPDYIITFCFVWGILSCLLKSSFEAYVEGSNRNYFCIFVCAVDLYFKEYEKIMEAAKFLKEFNRMCLSYGSDCKGCPFEEEDLSCILTDSENADSIAETVEKWSKEHPLKTRMEDFLEKYPNAVTFKASKGKEIPKVCCMSLGYTNKCYTEKDFSDCTACWNEPLY